VHYILIGGVRSQESGVRSQESGVRSQEEGRRKKEEGRRKKEEEGRRNDIFIQIKNIIPQSYIGGKCKPKYDYPAGFFECGKNRQ
jgi:hypothetical protein